MEETDYVLAFKSLSEKSTSFDAMDAYYAFIWDPALLEFIVNLHHKRGESKRRQQAVSFIIFLYLGFIFARLSFVIHIFFLIFLLLSY